MDDSHLTPEQFTELDAIMTRYPASVHSLTQLCAIIFDEEHIFVSWGYLSFINDRGWGDHQLMTDLVQFWERHGIITYDGVYVYGSVYKIVKPFHHLTQHDHFGRALNHGLISWHLAEKLHHANR